MYTVTRGGGYWDAQEFHPLLPVLTISLLTDSGFSMMPFLVHLGPRRWVEVDRQSIPALANQGRLVMAITSSLLLV